MAPPEADSIATSRLSSVETGRLRLRPIEPRDTAPIERLFTDPDVMRHAPAVVPSGAGYRWLAAVTRLRATHGIAPWTVELHDGTFVGQCGPMPFDFEQSTEVEMVCFFERPFWRFGFAEEAGLAAAQTVFDQLAIPRIIGLVDPRNRPARRLAIRCGLTFERDLKWRGATWALYTRYNETPG